MANLNTQPYLLVRWMSAVYQKVPVILVPPSTVVTLPILKVNGTIQKGELLIPDPAPDPNTDYETENEWTATRRTTLINYSILLSKSISLDICVVFGNEDAVYVDPLGGQVISKHPPSGGIDPITGKHYEESQTNKEEESLGLSKTIAPKKPLSLYIEKGDIFNSTLYLSNPEDEQLEYPTLREYLEDIKSINTRSEDDLWQYIEDNGLCDESELKKEDIDPETIIGDLDEELDSSSWEASEWMDQYYMRESPEALAFDFLGNVAIGDVPGVALVEGDRPGSNLTFVEIEDLNALEELQKALGEEGYEVTIKRF